MDFSEANNADNMKEEEYLEEFEEQLLKAIKIRLMSDVSLGVFLSGGVDSSLVVALMKGLLGQPVKTFSIGYEESEKENEFEYSTFVAQKYNTEHHKLIISPGDFRDFIPRLVWHMDEPLSDPAAMPLFFLSFSIIKPTGR